MVTSVAVGDVDADGMREVVVGNTLELIVAGFSPTISAEWRASSEPYPSGKFSGGALARIGAGTTRLMFSTAHTRYATLGMCAIALDASTGTLEYGRVFDNLPSTPSPIDVVDYDGDSVDELFLGSIDPTNGNFFAYDFVTRSIELAVAFHVAGRDSACGREWRRLP